ncbi:MAG: alpha-glucosidase, partial [Chloroflexota bacterium]
IELRNGGAILASSELSVAVEGDGSLSFNDSSGHLLRSELPPQLQASAGRLCWTHLARLASGESVYGLGERAAPLNRRGRSYQMWNSDPGGSYGPGKDPVYVCIPLYLSLHDQVSCLVFYENPYPGEIELEDQPAAGADSAYARACFEGGMLRYYVIPGPPDKAIERYTRLTGRAPMPPRWALGFHQCRWGYKTEADIRQVAEGFKRHDLPLSAIHLDIDYMDGYRVFTFDPQRFPDVPGLKRDLAGQGIHLVTIIDPGVKRDPGYFLYRQGAEKGYFCTLDGRKPIHGLVWPGWSAFPDFTNPDTRLWWGEQYRRLLESGVDGFWHDMNEPTSFSTWGDVTLPLPTRHHMDGAGGDHRQGHNLYGLMMNRAGFEGLHRLQPDRRPWIVSRAGWAGQQRFAWNWTGDTETSWESLRMTIPTVLGLGLSGQPFSGPDIGGFSGDPSAELFLRWFQLAAFLPYFRIHSSIGTAPREPWVHGEPVTSIVREFLRLRYRLMPYLYTLAWQATQDGQPLARPLFWPDGSLPALHHVDDAFLLGDDLLVAPILEEGAQSRTLMLPQDDWIDYWDGSVLHGPGQVTLPAGLDKIPLLVRAGSILPLEQGNTLELHAYPDQQGRAGGLLYSDSGDGYREWRLDRFSLEPGREDLAQETEGAFAWPYESIMKVMHPGK